MRWRVLGIEIVETDDGPVVLSPRSRSVLLLLLLDANHPVSFDRLATCLWGDQPPRAAHNTLARFIADLRKSLGPARGRIETTALGYRVVVHDGELDVDSLRTALGDARAALAEDPEWARAVAKNALGLVQIRPTQSLSQVEDVQPVVRMLGELIAGVLDCWATASIRLGRFGDVVGHLETAVNDFPYDERLWAHLITALHGSGRSTDATRMSHRVRQVLAEVGLRPSAVILDVEAAIFSSPAPPSQDPVPTHQALPALGPHPASPFDVHWPTTSLVGREAELAELRSAVGSNGVVSIVGLGGSGKTRLMLEAAALARDVGVDVHCVGLGSVHDPALVVPAIASAVGVPSSTGAVSAESLAASLSPHRQLLVLDGCEHVAERVAVVIDAIRSKAPAITVMLTSRIPLSAAAGGHIVRLGPLPVPDRSDDLLDSAAIELFLQRAWRHLPEPPLDIVSLDHVAEIVRCLAGLPLAIEIAAASLAHQSLGSLRQRVALSASGEAGRVDAGSSVRHVIEWTWDSLDGRAQTLLARMSVFRNGCTLPMAEDVCAGVGSVAPDLERLLDHGLVTTRTSNDELRYTSVDTVREFAAARLEDRHETGPMLDRLVRHLAGRVDEAGLAETHAWAHLSSALMPEQGNIEVALAHLRDARRPEDLVWLAVGACAMWLDHGMPGEVNRWLGPLVDDPFISDAARSAAAAMLMQADHAAGNLDKLVGWGLRSLELGGGQPHDWLPTVAAFLRMWGWIHPVPVPASELLDLATSTALGSRSRDTNLALIHVHEAHVQFAHRDFDAALAGFRAAKELTRHPGRLLLLCEIGESLSLTMVGRHGEAVASVEEWASRSDTDEWHYIVDVIRAVVSGAAGDPEGATAVLAADVRRLRSATIWGRADDFQAAFGMLADLRGEHELAAQLLAAPMSRYLLLATVIIDHVARSRGRADADGFAQVGFEMLTRVFPHGADRGSATTADDLVDWWSGPPAPTGSRTTTPRRG